jgi:hypothetical protein
VVNGEVSETGAGRVAINGGKVGGSVSEAHGGNILLQGERA